MLVSVLTTFILQDFPLNPGPPHGLTSQTTSVEYSCGVNPTLQADKNVHEGTKPSFRVVWVGHSASLTAGYNNSASTNVSYP